MQWQIRRRASEFESRRDFYNIDGVHLWYKNLNNTWIFGWNTGINERSSKQLRRAEQWKTSSAFFLPPFQSFLFKIAWRNWDIFSIRKKPRWVSNSIPCNEIDSSTKGELEALFIWRFNIMFDLVDCHKNETKNTSWKGHGSPSCAENEIDVLCGSS